MSDRPTLVRFVKDRNRSSNHERGSSGVVAGAERPGPDDLHGHEGVGERPGEDSEGRAGRIQLVRRHDVVAEHVPDERIRRVEVEGGVEHGRSSTTVWSSGSSTSRIVNTTIGTPRTIATQVSAGVDWTVRHRDEQDDEPEERHGARARARLRGRDRAHPDQLDGQQDRRRLRGETRHVEAGEPVIASSLGAAVARHVGTSECSGAWHDTSRDDHHRHHQPRPARQGAQAVRLDQLLVERGLVESRARGQTLLLAGKVRVGDGDGARLDHKPGDLVTPGSRSSSNAPSRMSAAAATSSPPPSTRSASTRPATSPSTSAHRPAASRTSFCSAAPATSRRSTSAGASSRSRCAATRG